MDDSPDAWAQLVARLRDGSEQAAEALFSGLYAELRQRARRVFAGQRADHTLTPTVLVHEAYLKLVRPGAVGHWRDRLHFLNVASRAMRQVFVNHARERAAQKRGGPGRRRVTLSTALARDAGEMHDLLSVHEALEQLEACDARQARIAELRLFGGLTVDEVATVLGVGKRTVEADWRMAKDFLAARLRPRTRSGGEGA